MSSGPPVQRTLTFDAETWNRIGRIARERGASPDALIVEVAARVELSPSGELKITSRGY